MSHTGCPAFTMLSTFLLTCFAALAAQQPSPSATAPAAEIQDLLQHAALVQDGKTYLVQDVLEQLYPYDPSLKVSLESNAEYLSFYLNSLRFYDQVRWFSNMLILDRAGIPAVGRDALENEALDWAAERRGNPASAASSLALAALEIGVKARLIATQPEEFSNQEIRTHFNTSIPEYFGLLKISWIRIPLFDMETDFALSQEKRQQIYQELDDVGKLLGEGKLEWDKAVETYSKDPVSKRNGGRVGYLKRDDNRFDEPFMRQLFLGFGITIPETAIVRGPIMGSRWVYLVRIENIKTQGVVELSRVRDRVIRSLRLSRLHAKLTQLAAKVERKILLPITPE